MLESENDLKVDSKLVSTCPVCGMKMEINIRKDFNFVEDDNWHRLNDAYENFLKTNKNKRLVLLEFLVGFNTPDIIRFPFEQLAYANKNISEKEYNFLKSQFVTSKGGSRKGYINLFLIFFSFSYFKNKLINLMNFVDKYPKFLYLLIQKR